MARTSSRSADVSPEGATSSSDRRASPKTSSNDGCAASPIRRSFRDEGHERQPGALPLVTAGVIAEAGHLLTEDQVRHGKFAQSATGVGQYGLVGFVVHFAMPGGKCPDADDIARPGLGHVSQD